MIRKQGLIGLLIFAALVLLVFYLFTDSWLESKLENAGTTVVGAKVDIDNLDFSLFSLRIAWDRIQITDPQNTMYNMFETGQSEFDMEFLPLFSRKVIIEDFKINDVRTNTEREEDGRIEKKKVDEEPGFIGKTMNKLENEVAAAPVMNLSDYSQKINVDSIVALLDLQTPQKYNQLEMDIRQDYNNWEERFDSLNFMRKLTELEERIKSVDVENMDDVTKIQTTLGELQSIRKSADDLTDQLQSTKADLNQDVKEMKDRVSEVDDWIREDFQTALSKARLPEIDAQSIGKMIFGKQVVDQVNTYLMYARKARTYSQKLKSDKPEDQNPPRLEGQDIYFYDQNARPDFWIKRIDLSGITETGISLSGEAENIVSDQRLIGAMTDFHIEGSNPQNTSIRLEGVFNYLEEIPSEVFDLSYSNFSLSSIRLSDSPYLPDQIESGQGTMTSRLELRGDKIDGNIQFKSRSLVFAPTPESESLTRAQQIIQDVVRQTKMVSFNARLRGEGDNITFSLSSNLDELFAQNLKKVVGKEVEQARQKIRDEVYERIAEYESRAENYVQAQEEKLRQTITSWEQKLEEKKQMIEEKRNELEERRKKLDEKLEKEKKKAEDEAKKKLKDIFDK